MIELLFVPSCSYIFYFRFFFIIPCDFFTCLIAECFFSKKALDSYAENQDVMVEPQQTYRGIPYYFGIDPVSIPVMCCSMLP